LNAAFVGQLNEDAVVGGLLVAAGTADLKKVSHTAYVGDFSVWRWGWVARLTGVNKVTARSNCQGRSCPRSHDFGFVGNAAILWTVFGGIAFVAVVWEAAVLAGVVFCNVVAMSPTIFIVPVSTLAFSIVVIVALLGMVGAVVVSVCSKGNDFEVQCCKLLNELFVCGGEIREHLAVGGGCCCKIGKNIGHFGYKGVHGIVGAVIAAFLRGSLC
jgi:hypothetical protein